MAEAVTVMELEGTIDDLMFANYLKEIYLDCYYHMVLCFYKHGLTASTKEARDKSLASAARQIVELEKAWGGDFGGADETLLSQQYDRPILVHRYPAQVKAFYMEPDANRPELALCVDVLAPEGYGEIIGGGQRASRLELLTQRIQEHQLPAEVRVRLRLD